MKEDKVSLPLGGLQHFGVCRRRWALIYIERQWEDNVHTVAGSLFHENAHNGMQSEKRGNLLITRGMEVYSRELAIHGICDVAEFYNEPDGVKLFGREGLWKPVPVEYKKGRATSVEADSLQLCAQAMCFEEMLCTEVKTAYIYYGENKRRTEIDLNRELRDKVRSICNEMHTMYERHYTPQVKIGKYCNECSLAEICLPKLNKSKSVNDYINSKITGGSTETE